MTIEQAKKDAIQVQDACNLSGVVFSFAQAMAAVCEEADRLGKGTEWKNNHPVSVLFASKLASLTHCERGVTLSNAWAACRS